MNSDHEVLPLAVMPSADEASAPMPSGEKPAEHTDAAGEAPSKAVTPGESYGAAKAFSRPLEGVLQSLGQDASKPAQSIAHAAEEAFRRQFELGMHFLEELVLARSPAEALGLQINFLNAQFELVSEQTREMQRHFVRAFTPAAKGGWLDAS